MTDKEKPLTFFRPDAVWTGEGVLRPGWGMLMRGRRWIAWVPPGEKPPPEAHPWGLAGSILIPAFTNFHAHLELTDISRPQYEGSFTGWLSEVMQLGPKTPEEAAHAARRGVLQSVRSGVGRVVDITRHPEATRNPNFDVTSCGEIAGLGFRHANGAPLLAAAAAPCPHSTITLGLAPHAPYSTAADWYRTAAEHARCNNLTLTTHLAETPDEGEFLAHHTGPFRDLWENLGGWDASVPKYANGPVRWLEENDVLRDTRLLAAHANDVTDEDLSLMVRRDVTVVHCPRTHAYFQRPPFDVARYQRAGVTVKLGTDSAASSGDLNLLADLQLFWRNNPRLSPDVILKMAIDHPMAIGADVRFVAWGVPSLAELLENPPEFPRLIW